MSKSKKRIAIENSKQRSLFDLIKEGREVNGHPNPGSFNIDSEFRELISQSLKECRHSRYYVAGKMSELTGVEITKTMLDSWTAESKEYHRFPAIFLPAFCEATGNSEPLQMLGEKIGVFVLPGQEALRAEIQRLKEKRERINKSIRKRKAFLREVE
ncbi:MAG: hypothetical protein SWO11_22375 [Thermodesulfobacteriota bacterium]|nr:hypothetical protein [Thermodesulfobacteriota bacterium]